MRAIKIKRLQKAREARNERKHMQWILDRLGKMRARLKEGTNVERLLDIQCFSEEEKELFWTTPIRNALVHMAERSLTQSFRAVNATMSKIRGSMADLIIIDDPIILP
jgi:hypothetical protein